MAIDYSKEKEIFKEELSNGEYDLDISPNEGVDYRSVENDDFLAFKENLDSTCSKALIAETLGK